MLSNKVPAVEPLSLSKFDVRDIDEPAWLYPELNFIIDHVGLPRLDDFCWIATRCPNVYGSLAVANMFIHNNPRHFAEIMANLLFWIGPDRIIWGTDFPIWYPHWLLDDFMAFQLPDDLKAEYGVDLTDEIKQKIIGGNIATDDLLLDLIGEIHSIFGFQVVWQLEGHKIIEEPVRVPDGEVSPPDDPIGPKPEEQIGHDFGKVAGGVVEKKVFHPEPAKHIWGARPNPTE